MSLDQGPARPRVQIATRAGRRPASTPFGFPEQLTAPTAGGGEQQRSIRARPMSQRRRVFPREFSPHPTGLHEPPQIVRLIGHHPPFCRMTFFPPLEGIHLERVNNRPLAGLRIRAGPAGDFQPIVSSPNTSRASRPRWAGSMSSGTVCPVVR